MIDIEEKRQKILEIIRQKGPILPVHVSKELGINSIFSSAILSEMVSSKTLRLSELKVGGSPLYYISGQEAMLENFTKFLAGKEKETFELLKKNLILQDDKIFPAERIALRSLKDFAVPLKISTEQGEKLFWKFYSLVNEDAIRKINMLLKKHPAREKKEKIKEKTKKDIKEKTEKIIKSEKVPVKIEKEEKTEFHEKIHSYLRENNITSIQEKLKKKKDVEIIVLAPSSIGKIEMLLVAKDKKNISDADLSLAFSKGSASKLPVLFLHKGKLTKKALSAIENFKNSLFLREL